MQIERVLDSFRITDEQLRHLMHILEEEMGAGLSPVTHSKASVKMFPTYVRNIPNGTEVGQVLALDLGGTNFRVLLIDLRGNAKIELTSKIFVIPQSIMIGDGKNVYKLHFQAFLFNLFTLVIPTFSGMFTRIYAERKYFTFRNLLSLRSVECKRMEKRTIMTGFSRFYIFVSM